MYTTENDADLGTDNYINEQRTAQPFFMRLKGRDIICTWPERKSGFFIPRGEGVVRVPMRAPTLGVDSAFSYSQVAQAGAEPEVFPARNLDSSHPEFLVNQDIPQAIVEWTKVLLTRLPELAPDERMLDDNGHVALQHRAPVASALSQYLSLSGDYRYSLTLRRHDKGDPTVDFLFNVKEGHCTRFAGGLALMRRAVGIPSRIVMGFRGLEGGQNGEYRVRMRQAHSWVQALVKIPDSDVWHWQTLDPTPPAAARYAQGPLTFFGPNGLDLPQLWQSYVLDFTADRQAKSQRALLAKLRSGSFWLVVGGCVGGVVALRRLGPFWRKAARVARQGSSMKRSSPEEDLAWYG